MGVCVGVSAPWLTLASHSRSWPCPAPPGRPPASRPGSAAPPPASLPCPASGTACSTGRPAPAPAATHTHTRTHVVYTHYRLMGPNRQSPGQKRTEPECVCSVCVLSPHSEDGLLQVLHPLLQVGALVYGCLLGDLRQ